MALASSNVRVGALPQPPRIPPLVKLPEKTVMMLSPRLATWSSTCLVAPLVRLTEPMTAPTPMMIPSIVRSERILLRRRARMAMRMEARILIGLRQFYHCLRLAQLSEFLFGIQPGADKFICDNFSIAKHDHPFSVSGNVQFMCDHDDG